MPIHHVDVMTHSPGECMVCHSTPTHVLDAHDPESPRVMDGAINLDCEFDWGEQAYLCMNCAEIVAGVIGWFPVEQKGEYTQRIRGLLEENKKLRKQNSKLQESRKRLLAGIQEVRSG